MKIFNFIRRNIHPLHLLYKFKFFRTILKNINIILLKKSNQFGDYFISLPRHTDFFFNEDSYEKNTFKFIKSLDKNLLLNKTFLDIGSNIGIYSLFLKKNYNSKIIIFEPDDNNLALLYKTLKKNKFDNFSIFPFALSGKTSMHKFLIDNVTGFNGTLVQYSNNPHYSTFVEKLELKEFKNVITIKLDDVNYLNLDDVSLVKMDTYGYEFEVISGMINLIKKNLPIIIVRSDENIIENIKNLLFPLNYQLKKIDLEPNYIFFK